MTKNNNIINNAAQNSFLLNLSLFKINTAITELTIGPTKKPINIATLGSFNNPNNAKTPTKIIVGYIDVSF